MDPDPDPANFVNDLQDANKKPIFEEKKISAYYITLTIGSGSGSGMPKNRWIRLIRIRIRNTAILVFAEKNAKI
jgi:hypothetical protein